MTTPEIRDAVARFGHHPDPAIDFCVEVEELENIAHNKRLGLSDPKHLADQQRLTSRIALAREFRVGGDAGAVAAKERLRKIEAELPTLAEEAVEQAALYVLNNSRRGRASLNDEQFDADTDKLMAAYRDIITKAVASGFLALSEPAEPKVSREAITPWFRSPPDVEYDDGSIILSWDHGGQNYALTIFPGKVIGTFSPSTGTDWKPWTVELSNPPADGDGWRAAPVVPTTAMLNAAVDATGAGSDMSWANLSPQRLFESAWSAMLAAAPLGAGGSA